MGFKAHKLMVQLGTKRLRGEGLNFKLRHNEVGFFLQESMILQAIYKIMIPRREKGPIDHRNTKIACLVQL